MLAMDAETYAILTSSSTAAPLPPQYQSPALLPPVPIEKRTTGLVPPPLFSTRKRFPTRVLHVTVHDYSPPASPTGSIGPSSPTTSFRSSTSSGISTCTTSAPASPLQYRPRHWEPSEPESSHHHAETMPRRSLRRKPSPKKESLRSLRVKDSEACLQRVYEGRLEKYLNGEIFGGWGCVGEQARDEW